MNKVLDTPFISLYFDAEMNLFSAVWKENTKHMSDDEFKNQLFLYIEKIAECEATKIFVDATNNFFIMNVEIQIWHDETIIPQYIENNVSKIAFLVPSDIFSAVSIQQTFEETAASTTKAPIVKLFEAEDEAKNWLLN